MASNHLNITIRFRVVECEPDGSPCWACGEEFWFGGKGLQAYIEHDEEKVGPVRPICKDCAEEFEGRDSDGPR